MKNQGSPYIPLMGQMVQQGNWLFARRGYLPIFLLIVGLFTLYFTHESNGNDIGTRSSFWLGFGIALIGIVWRHYTVGHTAENSSGRNVTQQVADQINTKGVYSLVRHPLYLGNYLIYLGISLFTGYLPFIILFTFIFVLYYERIICAEEKYLSNKFGEEYLDWALKTPTFFPSTKHFQSNSTPFRWHKAMEREKSGVLSFFIVVFLFEFVRCLCIDGHYWHECGWAFILGWIAAGYYFFFKYWKPKEAFEVVP